MRSKILQLHALSVSHSRLTDHRLRVHILGYTLGLLTISKFLSKLNYSLPKLLYRSRRAKFHEIFVLAILIAMVILVP